MSGVMRGSTYLRLARNFATAVVRSSHISNHEGLASALRTDPKGVPPFWGKGPGSAARHSRSSPLSPSKIKRPGIPGLFILVGDEGLEPPTLSV